MNEKELAQRGLEVSARLQNVQRRVKEAMSRDQMPEAISMAGKEGAKIARALMITTMDPEKIVILCEGDLERVVMELEYCAATLEKFVGEAIRRKKENPEASAREEQEAMDMLKDGAQFSVRVEGEDETANTYQFAAPSTLQ